MTKNGRGAAKPKAGAGGAASEPVSKSETGGNAPSGSQAQNDSLDQAKSDILDQTKAPNAGAGGAASEPISKSETGGSAPSGSQAQNDSLDQTKSDILDLANAPNAGAAQPGQKDSESSDDSDPGAAGGAQSSSESFTPKSIPGLAVICSQAGFWRAGRQWTKDETLVPLSDLSEQQIRLLRGERLLTVKLVELKDDETGTLAKASTFPENEVVVLEHRRHEFLDAARDEDERALARKMLLAAGIEPEDA